MFSHICYFNHNCNVVHSRESSSFILKKAFKKSDNTHYAVSAFVFFASSKF